MSAVLATSASSGLSSLKPSRDLAHEFLDPRQQLSVFGPGRARDERAGVMNDFYIGQSSSLISTRRHDTVGPSPGILVRLATEGWP
jgi:hypothetical protein